MRLDHPSVKKAKSIYFVVTGGIGRNICATAIVRAINKKFPSKPLYVIASCPEIFLKNPKIKKVHRIGSIPYLYDDIMENNAVVIDIEPYRHFEYVNQKKHFTSCWLEMLGLPDDNIIPEMFFNKTERDMAQEFLKQWDDPMILIQYTGGKNPLAKNTKEQLSAKTEMYRRNLNLETIQEVADKLMKDGYMIGSVQHDNQECIKGAQKICFPVRSIINLIPYVHGVIAIDSFLQHATANFNFPTVVPWGGTNPKILGYDFHKNLTKKACPTPMCHRPNSYLFDVDASGFLWDCPHDDACMEYKSDEIYDSITTTIKENPNARSIGSIAKSDAERRGREERKESDSKQSVDGKKEGKPCPCPD